MSDQKPPPVILQILPALNQGGIERGTLEIASAIQQAGAKAVVVSEGGQLVPALTHSGATHIVLPHCGKKSPVSVLHNARILARIIKEHKVSLVHARSRIPAWTAWFACRRTQTPFVTTWHGVHNSDFPGKHRYNAVLARGNRVIAISRHIGQKLTSEYNLTPDQLRIIPRGADIRQFTPEAVSGLRVHSLSEQWNIPPDKHIILLPGRLTEWKGQAFLLQALCHLRKQAPHLQWCCLFTGTGSPENKFEKKLLGLIKKSGLTDDVFFTGHCSDMPAAFAMATVVVVPSLRPEPFGRVVVEAQAMCCPVIVTAHGAALETVRNGLTGLAIPPGDDVALADALRIVLEASPEGRASMGQTARNDVLLNYTTLNMQHATLGTYDELLGTHLAETFSHTMADTARQQAEQGELSVKNYFSQLAHPGQHTAHVSENTSFHPSDAEF
ncbi:glycosyltransferase family 4 protein [Acetobacter thailandicus]|uniref:Glycosyltransferase family 4 protein n=1 Tax=Acetobacter thailandicus TaxID=1502842 RepID=A0ABT3QBV7_9PROT|nr:glycosyltransferase family 4 protein [Acetobacter thailandicus]MCX2562761.1 glycosyltransferase family 4 protein [Acetobacter thailandicus]NHN94826.1 glycosyltransferase [Acetobacter thailandicus]